ncbi:efflux RND transporter periplasmic adaptor subunit [Gemmobacter sp.]|uniref:efflux RND transporter periplasmic adaptor subunit n=1 Tax=Gemmobacter sp. TaxID=1898957 RepID=UPI002B000D48|nr:HlyD family efflux transporter periplasmic adaptor subunit [Gemmobacter sp.]
MRRTILALAALALLALTVWALLPRPVAVELARIGPRTIDVTIEDEGLAEIREVFVVSAPIAGRLRRIDLQAGDPVVAGQTVVALLGPLAPALLDTRSRAVARAGLAAATAAVELAQAQVAQAEATLAFRITEADRAAALFERGTISRHLLDLAQLERDTAAAALDSARANLAVRDRERDSTAALLNGAAADGSDTCCVELAAPQSGRILRVLTEDDQVVAAGTPLVEIGDPADLRVRVDLLSRDAVRVRPGMAARIAGWGGGDIPATVDRVEPAATTRISALGIDEQRVQVLLRLDGPPQDRQALGHGYRVMAQITLLTVPDALSIPVGALLRDGSDWATFVAQDGRARLRTITLGARNDMAAQVLDGLAPGDLVLLHPSDLIADGTAIAPSAGP